MKNLLFSFLFVCAMYSPAMAATNVALSANVATQSARSGYPATNIKDGNRTTAWVGTQPSDQITLSFSSPQIIDQYILRQKQVSGIDSYNQDLVIQYSTDGANWIQIGNRGINSYQLCNPSYTHDGACSIPVSFGQGHAIYAKYFRLILYRSWVNGVLQNNATQAEVILNRF